MLALDPRQRSRLWEFILRLAQVLSEELGLVLETRGSATWKRRASRKGTEPDTCFYVANAPRVIGRRVIDRCNPTIIEYREAATGHNYSWIPAFLAAHHVQVPGIDHQVASVFWEFLNSTGPVMLDAECAVEGDPAFDVADCLNHLAIKATAAMAPPRASPRGDGARRRTVVAPEPAPCARAGPGSTASSGCAAIARCWAS